MNTLVVPTNRPERVHEFLEAWSPWPWDEILIVEDAPTVSASLRHARWNGDGSSGKARVITFSWEEIDASLRNGWIISRCDSAIRCYGFWRAWALGADCIFTLDDDCYPADEEYVRKHIQNLEATAKWQSTVPWMRVRGLPYANFGTLRNVYVSVGLWRGHPDLDSIQSLAHGCNGDRVLERNLSSRVMPGEQYFPMSGMNLAFRREVACLMYFPPMGANSPYARFDDIWAGLVVQRICRHLRYAIVCGQPVVEHRRASDPFDNLVKEAPGIRANEHMWEIIDAIPLRGGMPLDCMREMGAGLQEHSREDPYLARWGRGILEWCRLFDTETHAHALELSAEDRGTP
jgi:hypothetical protein